MWDFLATSMHDLLRAIAWKDYVIGTTIGGHHEEILDHQIPTQTTGQLDYG